MPPSLDTMPSVFEAILLGLAVSGFNPLIILLAILAGRLHGVRLHKDR